MEVNTGICQAVGSDLKRHCTHPVPNQNEAEKKCFSSIGLSAVQALNTYFSEFAKVLIQRSFFTT